VREASWVRGIRTPHRGVVIRDRAIMRRVTPSGQVLLPVCFVCRILYKHEGPCLRPPLT
jgi:hypothetical protein